MYYANQYIITYLSVAGGIDNSQTANIVIQDTTGIDTAKPGIAAISWADPLDEDTVEWIYYTSIDGSNEFQGVTRGAEKGSAKTHANGATVAFPASETHINQFADIFHSTATTSLGDNVLLEEQASAPTSPSAGYSKMWFDEDSRVKTVDSGGTAYPLQRETGLKDSTDGATVTLDLSVDNKFRIKEMGGNRTLALSNADMLLGKVCMLAIQQDGTGSRTMTWPVGNEDFATTDVDTGTDVITVGLDIPTGTKVQVSTTDTLPTGLSASTDYFVIRASATTIQLATSLANAQAGTNIDITGTGAGTHTLEIYVKWASGTEPTLSTDTYVWDYIGFIVEAINSSDADAFVLSGHVINQGVV